MAPDSRREGARAVDALSALLPEGSPAPADRPNADPHAASVAGLLVADFVKRPELEPKLAELRASGAFSPEDAETLATLARAMLQLVEAVGLEYVSTANAPDEEVTACARLRAEMLETLERHLGAQAPVAVWLHAVRAGEGIVDGLFDLRTLATLYAAHASALEAAGVTDPASAAAKAADAALSLERTLAAGDDDAKRNARETIARAWGPFTRAYARVAEAGRLASRGHGTERRFPILAAVAAHKRSNRNLQSLVPRSKKSVTAMPAVSIPKAPAPPADVAPVATAPVASSPESRTAERHFVELEVGVGSESNFYLGFTENLSSGGVFIATYLVKPIGSSVNVELTMPDGEHLSIEGTVRWTRGETAGGWPGMGVQFAALAPAQEAKIREFLAMREPMFYDD